MKQTRFYRGDFFILATVLLLAVGLLLFFLRPAEKTYCIVRQSRAIIKLLPTDVDTTFTIDGAYQNIVVIQDGKVFIETTTCPGEDCKHRGAIQSVGQSIVCLPNQVVIELSGDSGQEVDAIAN